MHEILVYSDRKGSEPVLEYMRELARSGSKDSRVKLNKIRDYVKLLSEHGTETGRPYVAHLEGDIWDLRPLRDRILFAAVSGGRFILLHSFMKQTQKTPKREIEQAKREYADFLERGNIHG